MVSLKNQTMSSTLLDGTVPNQPSAGPEKRKSQQEGPWPSIRQATDEPASPPLNLNERKPYEYQPLDESKLEIRLVTILPGDYDDPLEITLHHVSLDPILPQAPSSVLSLEQLRATLPPGWNAYQTIEERILFEGPDKTTTWVHPDPNISPTADLHQPHDTGDVVEYEALSYTWGSLNRSAAIAVYGGLTSTAKPKPSLLRVGANLSEALQYLRLRDEARVIWIDALCINQEDLQEREHQVQRMADIYNRACKVIAWLGPDHDDAGKALQGLKYLGEQVEVINKVGFAPSPGASEPTWYDPQKLIPFDDSFWAAVITLSQRPWFSRLWVIQEIYMGGLKSVLKCGQYEIPWSLFRHAVRCLAVKGPEFLARRHMVRLDKMCSIVPGQTILFTLATLGFHHHCSDPRDIIYGILSLAPPELQAALCVDYSSNTQLVYRQFFATYSSLQHRSDLLTFTGWPVAETGITSQPWPSWVPDWRAPIRLLHGVLFGAASASGHSCSEMVLEAGPPNSMRIKGVMLDDTISTVMVQDIGNLTEVLEKFRTMAGEKPYRNAIPETEKCHIELLYKYIDAIHQGLTADRLVDPPAWVQTRKQLRRDVYQNQDFSLASPESHPSWWLSYKSFIDYWWPGTKLFLTDRGSPGVCNWEVQSGMIVIFNTFLLRDSERPKKTDRNLPGEALFVPLGCVSPIAIRPTGNKENTFRVAGPVHLDGVMDGEALLGRLPDHWCVQYDISDESVKDKVVYKNLETGTVATTDPRLEKVPLPQQWEPLDWTRRSIDPSICCRYRNKFTGEVINYDPRMTGMALKGRGINIQEIVLV